jgi:site-specific DNA-methyltransferase (adenine-specific)
MTVKVMAVRKASRGETGKKRRTYIPGLAAFKFRVKPDWSRERAESMFQRTSGSIGAFEKDKIYYQDCIEGMKELRAKSVDLVIADPPFGLDFSGKEALYNRDGNLIVDGYQEVDDNYDEFTLRWMSELPRIMKDDATAYIFSGWTNLESVLAAARRVKLETINQIIWHYQFGVFTRRKFVTSHYHILLLAKNPKKYYFHKIEHYPLDVWPINRKYQQGQEKNGTSLPVVAVKKCIDFSSKPGDLVLDPFMGNGTTAVAAKENYRHFLGFEINDNLEPIVRKNLLLAEVGSAYRPYNELLPPVEELKKRYPRAYKEYMKGKRKRNVNGRR